MNVGDNTSDEKEHFQHFFTPVHCRSNDVVIYLRPYCVIKARFTMLISYRRIFEEIRDHFLNFLFHPRIDVGVSRDDNDIKRTLDNTDLHKNV